MIGMNMSGWKYLPIIIPFFMAAVLGAFFMHLGSHSLYDCSAARMQATDCLQAAQNYSLASPVDMFHFSAGLIVLFILYIFSGSRLERGFLPLCANMRANALVPLVGINPFLAWLSGRKTFDSDSPGVFAPVIPAAGIFPVVL